MARYSLVCGRPRGAFLRAAAGHPIRLNSLPSDGSGYTRRPKAVRARSQRAAHREHSSDLRSHHELVWRRAAILRAREEERRLRLCASVEAIRSVAKQERRVRKFSDPELAERLGDGAGLGPRKYPGALMPVCVAPRRGYQPDIRLSTALLLVNHQKTCLISSLSFTYLRHTQ